MEVNVEKVVTIRIPEDEVSQLYTELQSVEFTDEKQPLMSKISRVLGAATQCL